MPNYFEMSREQRDVVKRVRVFEALAIRKKGLPRWREASELACL